MWFLWTVVAGLLVSGLHVVATCEPAGWLMPNSQGQQPASDLVIHAQQLHHLPQELWPQCHPMLDLDAQPATLPHLDGQNLAICQELDSLLTGLQSSWHTLHHQSQACSVLGVTPGVPPCSSDSPQSMPTSSPPFNTQLSSIPKSAQQRRQQQQQQQQQQEQQQQLDTQNQCLQAGAIIADGISNSNKSPSGKGQHVSEAARAEARSNIQIQHSEHTLFPGPIVTASIGRQHQSGHDWSAQQQHLGLAEQQAAQSNERLALSQETTQGTTHVHWLWNSAVLSAQKLWENLIYDTQVVQKQLESEAQIGGQACRSCLVPHLHKSPREVVGEVVALLVLGVLCASGLFVAATFYRRRQSTRRQTQHNIATQRLRHFEKLQQRQQQQQQQRQEKKVRRSMEESGRAAHLPWLQSQQQGAAVAVKHTRHRSKASEPTIPSSPSASSSHSDAIGTQVRPHSNSSKAEEPKRAKSAQRSAVNLDPVDSLHHGLGRSCSDLSTEAAQHGPYDRPQQSMHSMHSMQSAEASAQDFPGSAPSTPGSMAGSTTFNPFHQPPSSHQTPPASSDSSKAASAASVDGSIDSLHAKQAASKRRNRHKTKGRTSKKSPPAKRRFIPGLDTKFDSAIHELPTPPKDPGTEAVRQKGTVQSVGCSTPSSSPSALPEIQDARRQLSVDAPIFVPTGYANMGNFSSCASHFPSQLPDWQPQFAAAHHYDGQSSPTSYQLLRTAEGSMLPAPALTPLLSQAPYLPFSTHLERVSPVGCPLYQEERVTHTPKPSVPKPSPRHSPTSVLPACLPLPSEISNPVFGSSICGSGCTSFPFATAGEHQQQLGSVGSCRGWGLPPLLEDSVGSPFPGMPTRTSDRPLHTTEGGLSLADSMFSAPAPTSAGTSMPEQPHVSIASSLPGFNSIWRTAKSTDTHSSEDTWQSFTADKNNFIW